MKEKKIVSDHPQFEGHPHPSERKGASYESCIGGGREGKTLAYIYTPEEGATAVFFFCEREEIVRRDFYNPGGKGGHQLLSHGGCWKVEGTLAFSRARPGVDSQNIGERGRGKGRRPLFHREGGRKSFVDPTRRFFTV